MQRFAHVCFAHFHEFGLVILPVEPLVEVDDFGVRCRFPPLTTFIRRNEGRFRLG